MADGTKSVRIEIGRHARYRRCIGSLANRVQKVQRRDRDPPGAVVATGDRGLDTRRAPVDPGRRSLQSTSRGAAMASRLVEGWVVGIGLRRDDCGMHSRRRTKPSIFYKKTGNLQAVQILLGHTKIESTVRYLGVGRSRSVKARRCNISSVPWRRRRATSCHDRSGWAAPRGWFHRISLVFLS
jgi:hypothetical protein